MLLIVKNCAKDSKLLFLLVILSSELGDTTSDDYEICSEVLLMAMRLWFFHSAPEKSTRENREISRKETNIFVENFLKNLFL